MSPPIAGSGMAVAIRSKSIVRTEKSWNSIATDEADPSDTEYRAGARGDRVDSLLRRSTLMWKRSSEFPEHVRYE